MSQYSHNVIFLQFLSPLIFWPDTSAQQCLSNFSALPQKPLSPLLALLMHFSAIFHRHLSTSSALSLQLLSSLSAFWAKRGSHYVFDHLWKSEKKLGKLRSTGSSSSRTNAPFDLTQPPLKMSSFPCNYSPAPAGSQSPYAISLPIRIWDDLEPFSHRFKLPF